MLCEKCKERPANVLITKIINGHKNEYRLCEVCAQQENAFAVHFEPKAMLHNIFADLFNSAQLGIETPQVSKKFITKCKHCDFTETNFAKGGKLGCAECYQSFEGKINPLLKRIHGSNRHTGKVPRRTGGDLTIKKEIEALRQELQEAVKKEEYEKAAELRDRIKELNEKLD